MKEKEEDQQYLEIKYTALEAPNSTENDRSIIIKSDHQFISVAIFEDFLFKNPKPKKEATVNKIKK